MKKNLKLHRETLLALTDDSVDKVAGGALFPPPNTRPQTRCYCLHTAQCTTGSLVC